MKNISLPRQLREIGKQFEKAGYEVYLVGGAIRNILAGYKPTDYDLASNALPQDVIKLFKRVIPTGIKHGTVTILYKGEKYEITTFRSEGKYSDGRHPDSVSYSNSIFEDLERRDFTINSIALNINTNEIIDPHNGKNDIINKLVKAIGNAEERFNEDGLRIIRAFRFVSQMEYQLDTATYQAIEKTKDRLTFISTERIQEELSKLLATRVPSTGLLPMAESGVMSIILPELDACRNIGQKGRHKYDVFYHSLRACDYAPIEKLNVRFAALLHDIGKPDAKGISDEGEIIFHNHDAISADITQDILRRLRLSNVFINSVTHLVRLHMFNYEHNWSDSAVRRFIARVGKEHIHDLLDLRRADSSAIEDRVSTCPKLFELEDRIEDVLSQDQAITIRDLAINGHQLSEYASIPKGPQMGKVLDFLLESVIEDPDQNSKDILLEIARNFYHNHLLQE